MATRKKATRARAPQPETAPEPPKPQPKNCAECNWFDYQTSRQGICRLRPPFVTVHPTDRCSFFERAAIKPVLGA